jgi:hypothetical protein
MKAKKIKLSDLSAGDLCQLTRNGMWWKVMNKQGLNNTYTYLESTLKLNTRCQRKSYRHKLILNSVDVYDYAFNGL